MTMETFIPMAKEALSFFVFTFTELMMLFIGISFIVGVLQELIPEDKVKTMLSGHGGRGYFIGAGLGALTPFCSCSTIPIMVGLLKARAGFGPTLAFLFTSPLVNPIIFGLFFVALGLKATIIYSVLALMMAIMISFLLEKANFQRFIKWDTLDEKQGDCSCQADSTERQGTQNVEVSSGTPILSGPQLAYCTATGSTDATGSYAPASVNFAIASTKPGRWVRIFKEAVRQFRTFLPYIIIGVVIGALAHGFVPENLIVKYAGPDNPFAVPVAAVIGVPLYVRVSTMIPIFIPLMAKGMSIGAVVALTIGGAGASLPEVIMLKRIFRAPLLGAFLAAVFFIAVTAGMVFNTVL